LCRGTEDMLQLAGYLHWSGDQEAAKVVDPARDECMDKSSC